MAINLHTKYEKKIQSCFTTRSLIAGNLSQDYSFTGAKTVRITTPVTVPMTDYNRAAAANRYGTPTEMQDTVQELSLTRDRSFSLVVDKGNNADQDGVKAAGRMLALQLAERAIPEYDSYCFAQLVEKAGTVKAGTEALSAANVCARISQGTQLLDDAEVPQDGRILFVPSETYRLLKHSDEFSAVESLAEAALAKGFVGLYDNMKVVKVPSGRWPSGVNFLIVHRHAATAPVKISDTRLHQDPPGISGNLIEGRQYYDCFVFAAKCAGVYAEIDTDSGASVCAVPTANVSGSTMTLSCTSSGAVIRYTTDGTDPRYSADAVTGTSVAVAPGMTVKAYAAAEGAYPSGVMTQVVS